MSISQLTRASTCETSRKRTEESPLHLDPDDQNRGDTPKEVSLVSNVRINPKHRPIDFERLAEAILDISITIDDDEEARRLGREIRRQLEHPKKGTV